MKLNNPSENSGGDEFYKGISSRKFPCCFFVPIDQKITPAIIWLLVFFIILSSLVMVNLMHPESSAIAAPELLPKPVYGWYVCRDLGLGPVPGVIGLRQRLKLCHPEDWVIYAYCAQPGIPVPPVRASCTRIGEITYRCGRRYQLLIEYRVLATPQQTVTTTPTLTSTSTLPSVVTVTPTFTPALSTPIRPGRPGGPGNLLQFSRLFLVEIIILLVSGTGVTWLWLQSKKTPYH